MKTFKRFILALATVAALSSPVLAQWQVPQYSVPIGKGGGFQGFDSALPGAAGGVFTSNGAAAKPSFQPVPGGPLYVRVQRVPPLPTTYGVATWGAYAPGATLLCSGANGSAGLTTCMNQAVALAFPYAVGTTASGYDFELTGGDEPANGVGSNRGGGAAYLAVSAPLQFPPIQGGKIRFGAVTFAPGIIINTCEMCDIDFSGAQLVYNGSTPGEVSLRLKPTAVTPLDPNFGVSPARIFITTVVGRARLDLSGHANANVDFTNLHITEMNWSGVAASGCAVLADSPVAGQNMNNNSFKINQLHGTGTIATAFCHGTAAPGGGALLGNSYFDLGIAIDSAGATNGFDEWGSNDEIHLRVSGLSTGYALKFESGACKNVAWIWSTTGTATVTDASGCTGVNANTWYLNGTLHVGGASIASNGADVVMANGGLFLGTQSSKQGFIVLNWAGGAAGPVITSAANGGSPILNTPNTSGTLASNVTAPIVLNGGTGNISCPTCAAKYVESAWTPAYSTDGTPGTPAYLQNTGSYERIEREITVRFALQTSGWTGGPTGNVIITGLPIANNATEFGFCVIGAYVVAGLAASNFGITALIAPSATSILLRQNGAAASAAITAAQIGATSQIYGFCNYRV